MRTKIALLSIGLIALTACKTTSSVSDSNSPSTPNTPNGGFGNGEQAVLWQQTAAEYNALCHQAFNAAVKQVNYFQDFGSSDKPPIIVMDIDETILDNSPYNGYLTLNNKEYSEESWKKWTSLAQAEAVPGAIQFIEHANAAGIPIYYISNRSDADLQVTIQNMIDLGIPVNEDNFYLKQEGFTKATIRDGLSRQFEIILSIGDNLADFEEVYERQLSLNERKSLADGMSNQFGNRYIILPNVMYGGWRDALEAGEPTGVPQPDKEDDTKFIKSFDIEQAR